MIGLLQLPHTAGAQTKTFTVDSDFDSGTLNNVRHSPVANQLILGRTAVSQTRQVWVTNTAPGGTPPTPLSPGWVLRLNTTIGPGLGRQTGRYDSVLRTIDGLPTGAPASGNNPGRVAIDGNGDAWVINRAYYEGVAQGSISKIAGGLPHCVDRNLNGVIDTSRDANNDGIIDPYLTPALGTPAAQVEYAAQEDECVLTTIMLGVPGDIPRAVAVDRAGKVWAATWQGHTLYRINPNPPYEIEASRTFTPAGSPSFPLTAWFYSAAAADGFLYLSSNPTWSASSATGQVIRVNIEDINQAQYVTCGGGAGTCGSTYGIVAIPGTGKAWTGGYSGTGLYRSDFDASPATCTCVAMPAQIMAVTLDLNGKIWANGYNTGNVYRINPNTNVIEATCATGGTNSHGISVDFDGFIWSIQDNPFHLVRFDPVAIASNCGRTNYPVDRGPLPVPAGQNPYSYSPYVYGDFTGVQLDRQAPYVYGGSWDGTFDGGVNGIPWARVSWNQEPQGGVPARTSLAVSARAADTLPALGAAPFIAAINGGSPVGVVGRYVQLRAEFTGPGWLTPVLSDVTVQGPCTIRSEGCCLDSTDCDDANLCTSDLCPAPGGACVHDAIAACCNADLTCDDADSCTTDTCSGPGGTCSNASTGKCGTGCGCGAAGGAQALPIWLLLAAAAMPLRRRRSGG